MTSLSSRDAPLISIIIIAYNMAREIPRTVQSFLHDYQTGIEASEIEIIVMENGSTNPVPQSVISAWPANVRYVNVKQPLSSPANALNTGVEMAKGQWICPVIDGARMVTPGILGAAKVIMNSHPNPVITTMGYHLGHVIQQLNVQKGYNQQQEDALLASIQWPERPYDLFKISCLGGSAQKSWFDALAESNVLIMKKAFYQMISGYDEAFDIPGGGLVNLDFFKRCIEHEDSQYVLLLGEASFHQYHGGVTTSRPVSMPSLEDESKTTWELYADQYEMIRGEPFQVTKKFPILYGEANHVVRAQTIKAALYVSSLIESK